MSWRDIEWIKRCAPYLKMVGTILFDIEMAKRFDKVLSEDAKYIKNIKA